tara:strand:+ start:364 stop:567 length:204 start_codon:yes stop_codon:yes gene_type:complete
MIVLTLNDTETSVPSTVQTIAELVRHVNKSPEHVVVECNETVYKGTDTSYTLQANDTINIVHFVGGG